MHLWKQAAGSDGDPRAVSILRLVASACIFVAMPAITLKAHYDGERIRLDEPFDIPPNTPLMVTVLSATEAIMGEDWIRRARESLAAAYGAEEPEYTTSDLRSR